MAQILKNNVSGVLGLALGASSTSMTLLDASSFPAPLGGDFYLLTLIGLNANGQEASWEIVKVTGKASNTLTVVRAQEGTTAAAWPVATTVQLRLTAGSVATPDVVAAHVGSSGASHAAASTSVAGFMSAADKAKLDGVEDGANNYAHPTSDGNLHVPATGVSNNGNVLTAGPTPGSISWLAPLKLGTTPGVSPGAASAGVSATAARSDHVHPTQTSITGNAGTATRLITPRTINGVTFDGSSNITINAADATARVASVNGSASRLTLTGGYTEGVFAVTGTTPALSPSNGSIQVWNLTSNSSPYISTLFLDGQSIVLLVGDVSYRTITWPASVKWKTESGAAPTLESSGYTVIILFKVGGVVYGARVGDA